MFCLVPLFISFFGVCLSTDSFVIDQVPYGLNETLHLVPYKKINKNTGKWYIKPPFSFKCPDGFYNNGTYCIQERNNGVCPDLNSLNYSIQPFDVRYVDVCKNITPNCEYSIKKIMGVHKEDLVDLELFFDNKNYPFKLYLDVTLKQPDLIDNFKDKISCWGIRHNAYFFTKREMFKNITTTPYKTYRFSMYVSDNLSIYVCHFINPTKNKPVISNIVYAIKNKIHTFSVQFNKSFTNIDNPEHFKLNLTDSNNIFVNNRFKFNDSSNLYEIIFATNSTDINDLKKQLKTINIENITSIIHNEYCKNNSEIINGETINWPETKIGSISYADNKFCIDNDKLLFRRCEKNMIWSKTISNCTLLGNLNENLSQNVNEVNIFKLINSKNINASLIDDVFDADLELFSDDLIHKLIDKIKAFKINGFRNIKSEIINSNFSSEKLNVTFPESLLNNTKNNLGLLTIFKINSSTLIDAIIDIDFDNDKIKFFKQPIILTFKTKFNYNLKCVYWDNFHHKWIDIGLITKRIDDNVIECHTYHLTRFSLLIIPEETVNNITGLHFQFFDIISAVESGISLVGVFIILIIAIISRDWRKTRWNIIHLSLVMFLELILLTVTICEGDSIKSYCLHIGASLHLLLLVKLSVCFLIAQTKFRDFAYVLKEIKKIKTKISYFSVLSTWIFPGIIVGLSLIFFQEFYDKGIHNFCYPRGRLFIYSVFIPATVLILVNTSIFMFIMFQVLTIKSNVTKILFQFKLAIMLWFLLGGTWLFSLLVDILPEGVFQKTCFYIFSFIAPLEGFIVFVFYVILDRSTK